MSTQSDLQKLEGKIYATILKKNDFMPDARYILPF